jgi:NADPH-dependent ferric siderophore reductase
MSDAPPSIRTRREPPAFRRLVVARVAAVTPRLMRVTVAGPELKGLTIEHPAASVRLLLPSPGSHQLVMPTWNGNEFLMPDGNRPAIRTLTPLRLDAAAQRLDLEIVVHEGGTASTWALAATEGDEVALSGPGRGYTVANDAAGFLLAGDESAIPAIGQVLEALPPDKPVRVLVEVADPAARLDLPTQPKAAVEWLDLPAGAPPGDAMVAAVTAADITEGTRIWAAGEAAAVQRIRRHVLDERAVPRSDTWIRGYWKYGRTGDGDDSE